MKRSITLALVGGVTATAAGAAIAAWTAAGSGNGTASTRTAQQLVVSAGTAAADLYPGGPAGVVAFRVSNPNPYPVRITQASFGAPIGSGGCASDMFAAGGPVTVAVDVPAGATGVAVSVPDAITLSAAAPDACQGVTASVPVTLSGIQTTS